MAHGNAKRDNPHQRAKFYLLKPMFHARWSAVAFWYAYRIYVIWPGSDLNGHFDEI